MLEQWQERIVQAGREGDVIQIGDVRISYAGEAPAAPAPGPARAPVAGVPIASEQPRGRCGIPAPSIHPQTCPSTREHLMYEHWQR